MKGLLLDTHIWFWYVTGSGELMPGLHWKIDQARDSLWLSAISIWELGMMQRTDRIRLDTGARAWVERALERLSMRIVPVDARIASTSLELEMHRDPADRFIAATSMVNEIPLVTVDPNLTAMKWLRTVSS